MLTPGEGFGLFYPQQYHVSFQHFCAEFAAATCHNSLNFNALAQLAQGSELLGYKELEGTGRYENIWMHQKSPN